MQQATVRVFVVEGLALFRQALDQFLATQTSIQVVGGALPDQSMFEAVMAAQPDVVLLDLGLFPLDPAVVIGRLRAAAPATRILMLSRSNGDDPRGHALATGADAFMAMDRNVDDLLSAVHSLAKLH